MLYVISAKFLRNDFVIFQQNELINRADLAFINCYLSRDK